MDQISPGVHHATIDLTNCYHAGASLNKLVRHVWLSGKNLVVVADQIEAGSAPQATYCWHGDPAASWWFDGGWGLIALGDARLWFTCNQGRLSGENLQQLPGSRGHLSLVYEIDTAAGVVWWVFALATDRPDIQPDREARQIRVFEQTFRL